MTHVVLSAGNLLVKLAPGVGGSIARFAHETNLGVFDLLRPAPEDFSEVRHSGCFPLVPFSNRIRDGRFEFRGRTVALPPNMPGQRHPLHGLGWRGIWSVQHQAEDVAELVFEHDGGGWPWRFQATQRFEIDESGLSVTLAVNNLSVDPMPAGLGFHPYFLCNAQTRLSARTASVWMTDSEILPTDRIAPSDRYSLRDRTMFEQTIDNGYAGWDGEATIDWGSVQLCMRSPATEYLQAFSPAPGANLYAPAGWGVFAAEPVTHANAVLNLSEAEARNGGIRILEQGETTELRVRFDVFGL